MEWAILGKFAKAYWSQLALGLLVIGLSLSLGITRHTLAMRTTTLHNTEVAYHNFQNEVKNKTEAAKLADQAHASAIKAKDEAIRIKNEQTLQEKLDAAQSDAADYARRLRIKATGDTRSVGPSGVGSVASAPGSVAGTSGSPEVDAPCLQDADDLRISAENTVKAQAWLDWWNQVKAVPDRE